MPFSLLLNSRKDNRKSTFLTSLLPGQLILALLAVFAFASCNKSGENDATTRDAGLYEGNTPTTADARFAGDPWPQVKERGSGSLTAVYVPAGGFAYHDDDGKLTGVTVELLRVFADFISDRHNVELNLDFVREENWRTFYSDIVDAGDGVIGMGNVTITEQRREELAFSPPYMTNIASLITHRDAPALTHLQDLEAVLAGRTALAFEGTLHEERLRELTGRYYPGARFRMAGSNDEIIDLVSSGDRYFAYIDLYNFWRAADQGLPLQRHQAADEAAEQFGYIMPRGTTWMPVIQEFFEDGNGLISSSRYRSIMKEHLGTRLAEILMEANASPENTNPNGT